MAHSPMPFNRFFALSLIFSLILPAPAHALRTQQLQDTPAGLSRLAAGMEEDVVETARQEEVLKEIGEFPADLRKRLTGKDWEGYLDYFHPGAVFEVRPEAIRSGERSLLVVRHAHQVGESSRETFRNGTPPLFGSGWICCSGRRSFESA